MFTQTVDDLLNTVFNTAMHRKRCTGSKGSTSSRHGTLKTDGDVMGGGVEGHAIEGYRALSGLSGEQQQVNLRDADAPADSWNQAQPALHITFKFPAKRHRHRQA